MKNNITKKTITREIVVYSTKCPKCGKEIKGYSEGQVTFNLLVHKQSKECKNENK